MISVNGILVGLGLMIAGVLMVRFTYQAANFTGAQDWLERFTGPGTTYGIYKMFGVVLVLLGILAATGFGNNAIAFLLSPLKNIFHPLN